MLQRSKRQIANYRRQGLGDYGGRPVMFDRAEVEAFIEKRRHEKWRDSAAALSAYEQGRNSAKQSAALSFYERGRLSALKKK